MTTDEHLDAIVARCTELLAIAEKRTRGEWTNDEWNMIRAEGYWIGQLRLRPDNDFIAACAGTAEAGWRATIAAIRLANSLHITQNHQALAEILAAWPPETLNRA